MRNLMLAAFVALVGCGGGGGATPTTPIVVATAAMTSAPSTPPVTSATFSQTSPGAFPLSAVQYISASTPQGPSSLFVTFMPPADGGTYQQFVQVDSQPAVMSNSVAVTGALGSNLSSSVLMPTINGSTTFTWVVFNGIKSAVYSAVYQR